MTNLSFPIGKYKVPATIDNSQIEAWINEIEALPQQMDDAVKGLSDEQLDTPYRPDGWTIRQVIHHVPDSHIGSYTRFHWALTEDNPTIKAYDEKAWSELSYQQNVPIEVSLNLLRNIHIRWSILLRSLTTDQLERTFIHPEDGQTYILKNVIGMYAWHGKHHLEHILSLKRRMNW